MSNIARQRIEAEPTPRPAPRPGRFARKTENKARLRSIPPWEPVAAPRVEPAKPVARATGNSADVSSDSIDRRSALATYLRDVRRYPLLSREEEHRIASAYVATGDQRLANQLVAANLRLVVKISLEYRTAHGNVTDLAALETVDGIDKAKLEQQPKALRFD